MVGGSVVGGGGQGRRCRNAVCIWGEQRMEWKACWRKGDKVC
jgi:hypothetical protein